jgi:hypothetical protein
MKPSNHGKIPLCKILYFAGGWYYWWNGKEGESTIEHKMAVVPCMPTALMLTGTHSLTFMFQAIKLLFSMVIWESNS